MQTLIRNEDGEVTITRFQRARINFAVTRADFDGETSIVVEWRDLDADGDEFEVDSFGGYEGDISGMGVCPVAAAREFVWHRIRVKTNPEEYGQEALAPYGLEWLNEQEERRGR